MKSIILAGNWKMNFGPKDTLQFLTDLKFSEKPHARMRFYVPYVSLTTALTLVKSNSSLKTLEIGAQNIHFEKSGAYTGEISGPMLQELGVQQVLIGHSERRQYFNESNDTVLKRVESSLLQGFEVLLCIGETLQERNAGKTEAVLTAQLEKVLNHSTAATAFGTKMHIAYEPVWAIGTGVVATPEQAETAHLFIRNSLKSKLGQAQSEATKLLYGGSVAPNNFKDLLTCPNIDGGLVGGASLKLESWQQLWNLV